MTINNKHTSQSNVPVPSHWRAFGVAQRQLVWNLQRFFFKRLEWGAIPSHAAADDEDISKLRGDEGSQVQLGLVELPVKLEKMHMVPTHLPRTLNTCHTRTLTRRAYGELPWRVTGRARSLHAAARGRQYRTPDPVFALCPSIAVYKTTHLFTGHHEGSVKWTF